VIVVDTNLLVYLALGGEHAQKARRAYRRDPDWAVPPLWRSEFRSACLRPMRKGHLSPEDAILAFHEAEALLYDREFDVESALVLGLALSSACSAYDCEFVALARDLGVPLVTSDGGLIAAFPDTAVPLDRFARR
jgi:predicted nucleic acid-binding protein